MVTKDDKITTTSIMNGSHDHFESDNDAILYPAAISALSGKRIRMVNSPIRVVKLSNTNSSNFRLLRSPSVERRRRFIAAISAFGDSNGESLAEANEGSLYPRLLYRRIISVANT